MPMVKTKWNKDEYLIDDVEEVDNILSDIEDEEMVDFGNEDFEDEDEAYIRETKQSSSDLDEDNDLDEDEEFDDDEE